MRSALPEKPQKSKRPKKSAGKGRQEASHAICESRFETPIKGVGLCQVAWRTLFPYQPYWVTFVTLMNRVWDVDLRVDITTQQNIHFSATPSAPVLHESRWKVLGPFVTMLHKRRECVQDSGGATAGLQEQLIQCAPEVASLLVKGHGGRWILLRCTFCPGDQSFLNRPRGLDEPTSHSVHFLWR